MNDQLSSSNRSTILQSTSRQLVAVIFVLSISSKMFLQPIALLHAVGRDAYIAMAIDSLIDLVSLGLIVAAIRLSGENDLFSMLVGLVGKAGAKIIMAVIGLFLFFKLTVSTSETLIFYSDSLFAQFDISVMILALLFFLLVVASHTLKSLSRLTELLSPLVVVGIAVLTTIVIVTRFDVANVLPFMRSSGFGNAVYRHATFSGDFTPLIFFVGRTKTKRRTPLFSALAGVAGTSVALFFSVVMSAAFGNVPMLSDSSTNLSTVLQYSIGNVYGRIDLFSTALWSISAFLETAFFFFATCKCFSYLAGEKAHWIVSLVVAAALYFIEVFAMTDPTILTAVTTSAVAATISLTCTIIVPLTALIVCIIDSKKRRKGGSDMSEGSSGMREDSSDARKSAVGVHDEA